MTATTPSGDDLRGLVRETLAQLLPDLVGAIAPRSVAIGDDAELNAFVREVVRLLDNSATGPLLRGGSLTFSLADPARAVSTPPVPAPNDGEEVVDGVVTERMVAQAAAAGRHLVLGPGAVITPLAREMARRTGTDLGRASC